MVKRMKENRDCFAWCSMPRVKTPMNDHNKEKRREQMAVSEINFCHTV
jgi:hypothetical protein